MWLSPQIPSSALPQDQDATKRHYEAVAFRKVTASYIFYKKQIFFVFISYSHLDMIISHLDNDTWHYLFFKV